MASEPSERVALASLRTSAPPSEIECDAKDGAASDGGLQGGDVERVDGFLLDFVVVHHGAFAHHDFGDGVVEVDAIARALVALHDGALRVGAHQNQRARMNGDGLRRAAGQVEDFDGLFDDGAASHADQRAIRDHRRVERHEGVLGERSVLAEVRLDDRRVVGEAAHLRPAGRLSGRVSRWPLAKTS